MTRRRSEEGFTLVELMVVILIIAILLAIAIPTFFRARQQANDRAVQSNVRNALTATRIYYNDDQRYTADTTAMSRIEPSLIWSNTPLDSSASDHTVYLAIYDTPSAAQTVVVGGRTDEGRCFYIKDIMGGSVAGTYYDSDVDGDSSCPAPDPAVITAQAWD